MLDIEDQVRGSSADLDRIDATRWARALGLREQVEIDKSAIRRAHGTNVVDPLAQETVASTAMAILGRYKRAVSDGQGEESMSFVFKRGILEEGCLLVARRGESRLKIELARGGE